MFGPFLILAQQMVVADSGPSLAVQLLARLPWFAWVAIVAILCSSISGILVQVHRHRERMAMIQNGLYPDGEPPEPAYGVKPNSRATQEL